MYKGKQTYMEKYMELVKFLNTSFLDYFNLNNDFTLGLWPIIRYCLMYPTMVLLYYPFIYFIKYMEMKKDNNQNLVPLLNGWYCKQEAKDPDPDGRLKRLQYSFKRPYLFSALYYFSSCVYLRCLYNDTPIGCGGFHHICDKRPLGHIRCTLRHFNDQCTRALYVVGKILIPIVGFSVCGGFTMIRDCGAFAFVGANVINLFVFGFCDDIRKKRLEKLHKISYANPAAANNVNNQIASEMGRVNSQLTNISYQLKESNNRDHY